MPKMSLSERDDPLEVLALDRKHEPLGEGVQIGAPWRKPNDLHSSAFESGTKLGRVERISVEHQIALSEEEAVVDVEQVPGDLLHPRPVGVGFDPGDLDLACGDIDDELTAKGFIVPGLGDAGDLAYGSKIQA